jgi:transketolase
MTEKDLKKLCNTVRQDIISMLFEAGSGHPGGSLSVVEILVSLYFGGVLNHDPKNPKLEKRDRFFLSKAHACPALYTVLARAGYLPLDELKTLRKLGSRLQGHLDRIKLPCLESSAGALGEGLSLGIGAALAAKFDKQKWWTYVLMSDGEQEEGQTMEAMMFAKQYKVDNLTAIIDVNGLQIDDWTIEEMGGSFLKERYEAFGWYVLDIDGHNIEQIIEACQTAKSVHKQPVVILARTIKGKGVSFMENKLEWHGQTPNKEQTQAALKELKEEAKEIDKIKEVI